MTTEHLPNLTIEFLEDAPDGLRLVSQANWSVECLLSSRHALPRSLGNEASFKWLDVPGVYLLMGHVDGGNAQEEVRLYVGQADSVADRLDSHLKSETKKWWRAALVFRRTDKNPLNLSHCKYLESKLCALALDAGKCILTNKVTPQLPSLSRSEQSSADDFLQKALVIVSALGWDFFKPDQPLQEQAGANKEPKKLPASLGPLLEEIRKSVTGPSFPKAEWYGTRTPDYRAKCVSDTDFRVFARITWAKGWFWLALKDVGKYKVKAPADIDDELRRAIAKAYQKAEQYLQRGK